MRACVTAAETLGRAVHLHRRPREARPDTSVARRIGRRRLLPRGSASLSPPKTTSGTTSTASCSHNT